MADQIYKSESVSGTGVIVTANAVSGRFPMILTVGGPFVGTVVCETSQDNVSYTQFGAALSVPGVFRVDIACKSVRLRCSAYTSGTIVGDVAITY